MSKTFTFSVRTSTSARDTRLKRKTDVVITLAPSPEDAGGVTSKLIPWKILTFHAESTTYRSVTINPEIAVCTVDERDNGVLIPNHTQKLEKGGVVVLKPTQEGDGLYWDVDPPPYTKNSNAGITAGQQTPPTVANDSFIIRNEYGETKLALCLFEEDGFDRLPIVDLGPLPKGEQFTINGPLCLQAYAMVEPTVGKPLELMNYAPLLGPMAVNDLPESAFMLYNKPNGTTALKPPY
ncbi:uncharacterized protein EDB93DRAFT_1185546 [Suillus bovinus]|uniref:uncharacterized protein n=1 Tax=Suillus bovinus TaxID=48563 RepID=UPI001B885C41|nr:uncharacterized protein EDB93DRAFT_1185546 [Suillus bovinus]KAG2127928.1 hypothetical protein EDB93DRAFT_1185546 [Suillus bovinus]